MSINLNNNTKVLALIYADIEAYPPTLNLINLLSEYVERIDLVERSILNNKNIFEHNVFIHRPGYNYSREDQMKGSPILKLYLYLIFLFKIIKILIIQKPNVVIIYDPIPLVLYRLARIFSNKNHVVWYHNHDVLESKNNKFSISYWISKFENTSFSFIDIFTLPSIERMEYFPINKLKGKYYFLPNFPSKKLYEEFFKSREKPNSNEFHIIFQGNIGNGHGIEEIINILGYNSELNKTIFLNLKGLISKEYKEMLLAKAKCKDAIEYIKFHGFTSYKDVPRLASKCQLGIAIFTKTDLMNSTLGSSSNKIYEYAAVGTPIIYFDNTHFKKYLSTQKWAFSSDLSEKSILNIICKVDKEFNALSKFAFESFFENYNYEIYFDEIIKKQFFAP